MKVREWSERAGLKDCLVLFVLAALPRLAYVSVAQPPFETYYWALADGLIRTGSLEVDGVRVTDFEPLYPAFLAVLRVLTGDRAFVVQVLQIAASSAGAVFLYRLSLTLTGSRTAAALSAALFAFHPLLVRQAGAASDLALVSTMLIAFAYVFVSMRSVAGAALAGVWLGLTVLTRSMVLPLLACGAAILLATRQGARGAAFIAAAGLVIFPFALQSYVTAGIWLPTRSGMNLYIGNSPYTEALLPDHDLDLLQDKAWEIFARERPDVPPAAAEYARELDAFLTRRAVDHMMARPLHTLGQKAMNAVYFLSPRLLPLEIATPGTRLVFGPGDAVAVEGAVPRPRVEVIAYAVTASVVLLAALGGVCIRRDSLRRDAMLWSVLATCVAVNVVYVPATRYLAPTMFVLLFYAGVGIAALRKDADGRSVAS